MIENWEKISEELVQVGWRKIMRRTFKMPDGKIDTYDVMYEGDCACIFGLTPDNQVVIARQFRPGPEKIFNELPGGASSDNDASPEEAAKREFLEETGYTGEFKLVGKSVDDAYSTRLRYHFVATNCTKIQEPKTDYNEFTEAVTMPLSDFRTLLASGEFTDSETAYRGLEYLKLL